MINSVNSETKSMSTHLHRPVDIKTRFRAFSPGKVEAGVLNEKEQI